MKSLGRTEGDKRKPESTSIRASNIHNNKNRRHMNLYTEQLKESIREKLDHIEDPEYLSSLDAILTFETYGSSEQKENTTASPSRKKTPLWKKLGFL